jgi:hypothetical protein
MGRDVVNPQRLQQCWSSIPIHQMKTGPLLVPDLNRLRNKLASPSPLLGELLARFRKRLVDDVENRAANIHLLALLGESDAIVESKAIVLRDAQGWGKRGAEEDGIENHTWCAAPSPMRLAVYYDWHAHLGAWTESESRHVAESLLHFSYEHAVAVLRARIPSSDNQSFSLALCCAVIGYVFRDLPAVAEQARSLHEFGMRRLSLVLGLSPRDGYLGEGSTYQSHVVSPLAMWAAAFLMQIDGPDALTRRWGPSGARLLDILRVEGLLGSPGSLLPGWDHYGWQPKANLSAIAFLASITGETDALLDARDVWDRPDYIAWGRDDQMWSLIYWPDEVLEKAKSPSLSGWSLPHTGAAIDDPIRRARLMLVWDENSPWLQAISRGQANPNHVLYELDGQPIFADGSAANADGFLGVTPEKAAAPLNAEQRELIKLQYGSIDRWANAQHAGFVGAANTVIIDDEAEYFPVLAAKHGRLCFEHRSSDRHVITADSVDYFWPRYDLTRAQRTISMGADGVCWIVDDYRAASAHQFTWQLYLRVGCTLTGDSLSVKTSDGQELTLAWIPIGAPSLDRFPSYPSKHMSWPDEGSERLRFSTRGKQAEFVMCVLPWRAKSLSIRALGDQSWRAEWDGGSDTFTLPEVADSSIERQEETPEATSDLDHDPFALSDEPDDVLLRALDNPDKSEWRRTTIAMQTLTLRRVAAAMPMIDRLLHDTSQRYLVHSVAAWCLGRAQYRSSLERLRYLMNSPETNTAVHARWAVERMSSSS